MSAERVSLLYRFGLSALATVLACGPHLVSVWAYGNTDYVANFDDQIYMAIARQPYFTLSATLHDALTPAADGRPALYGPLLFTPYGQLTRLLGWSPTDVLFAMRLIGPTILVFALYPLYRRLLSGLTYVEHWAGFATAVSVTDHGWINGRLLADNWLAIWMGLHSGFSAYGDYLLHYRVAATLVCLPPLLMVIYSLSGDRPGARDVLLGTTGLTLLMYMYFFYWTAAIGGVLIFCMLVWSVGNHLGIPAADQNRLYVTCAVVLSVAVAAGSWQVWNNVAASRDPQYHEALARISRGVKLEDGDPRLYVQLRNYLAIAKIVTLGVVLYALRLRRFVFLYSMALAGFLLLNSGLVTRREFENNHWVLVVNPVTGVLIITLFCLFINRFMSSRTSIVLACALVSANCATGLFLRTVPTQRARWSVERTDAMQRLRPVRPVLSGIVGDCTIAGTSMVAEMSVVHTPCAPLYSEPYTAWNTPIPSEEVHMRHALNSWLEGWDGAAYQASARAAISPYIHRHPEWSAEAAVEARLPIFSRLASSEFRCEVFRRLRPTHLVMDRRSGRKMPSALHVQELGRSDEVLIYRIDRLDGCSAFR